MEKILIIEDERPAYEKLLKYLQEIMPQTAEFMWAKNSQEVQQELPSISKFSLIIADIQLKESNVFDILIDHIFDVPVIFCTAYDEYMAQAFQTNGIAYILKPYDRETLQKAIDKYEILFDKLKAKNDDQIVRKLKNLLNQKSSYKSKLITKNSKNEMSLIESSDISTILAVGEFCKIYTKNGVSHTFSEALGKLELKLEPKTFFRINRSQIINIDHIDKMEPYFKNRLKITMKGYHEKLTTSSTRTADFRVWLES